jgi:hypothetical protein
VPGKQQKRSVVDMKKQVDELRPEYDLSQLTGCVRGKYAVRAKQGSNIVLLASDVAEVFHDDASVNEALRTLIRLHSQKQQRLATV